MFLPYIAPSRPPTNLTLLPLGKDELELRWKVSLIASIGVKQTIIYILTKRLEKLREKGLACKFGREDKSVPSTKNVPFVSLRLRLLEA